MAFYTQGFLPAGTCEKETWKHPRSDGRKIKINTTINSSNVEHLLRQDESSDDQFYVQPRLVYHIDDGAVAALTKYYKTVFTEGASVLDIASSW